MNDRDQLLAMVASMYYHENFGQSQIADRLGVSSSKVSRMLKEARDRGIVDIRIRIPVARALTIEKEMIDAFGIQDAHVLKEIEDADEATLLRRTGEIAAEYLQQVIPTLGRGSSVGVAWGTSVHATVSALPDNSGQHVDVVQLMGGVGALAVDGPDLARMVAVKLGGRHYDLHAPVIVERPEVRTAFLSEPTVQDAIHRAQSVQLAITGIGSIQPDDSSFLRAGLLTHSDLARLRNGGAVGEMVGRFFGKNGEHDDLAINQRIIGIELDDLCKIPLVLAIARGVAKAPAILAALRAGYISVLATDEATANAILELNSASVSG
ncbi:MAG: sugar-binding transcriptional regulator [Caldilineaceae bacterium]